MLYCSLDFRELGENCLSFFEIIVRSKDDGRFIVACPTFPDCESEGASVEEAVEGVIEKIADHVTMNIKNDLKEALRGIGSRIPQKGPFEFSQVLTRFPVSLN